MIGRRAIEIFHGRGSIIVSVLYRFADKLIKREPPHGGESAAIEKAIWKTRIVNVALMVTVAEGTGPRTADLFTVNIDIGSTVNRKPL